MARITKKITIQLEEEVDIDKFDLARKLANNIIEIRRSNENNIISNKVDEKTFKNIIVRMIGRFDNKPLDKQLHTKFNKIANKDETITYEIASFFKIAATFKII